MNTRKKVLYLISGFFFLFFAAAMAMFANRLTVGATVSAWAVAVLTLAGAIISFVLCAKENKTEDKLLKTRAVPMLFFGFATVVLADAVVTAVNFEGSFDAVRILAELIIVTGHIGTGVIMLKNDGFADSRRPLYIALTAMTGNPASIFVSSAFNRQPYSEQDKKLRRAGVLEIVTGAAAVIIIYAISLFIFPSDIYGNAADFIFLLLTLVTDTGLAMITAVAPRKKEKKAKKNKA